MSQNYIYLLLFLLGDATRSVYSTFSLFRELNPILAIFVASLFSFILTIFISKRKIKGDVKTNNKNFILYVSLNVFTCMSWVCGYFAIYYIIPSVMSGIAVSIGPILYTLVNSRNCRLIDYLLCLVIILLSLIYSINPSNIVTINGEKPYALLYGVCLSILCGISIFANTILSTKLSRYGEAPLRINTYRSLLVLFLSFIICIKKNYFSMSKEALISLLMFSFFLVLIPQITLQLCIQNLGSGITTTGIALSPIFCMFTQILLYKIPIPTTTFLILILNIVVLIIILVRQHKLRRK